MQERSTMTLMVMVLQTFHGATIYSMVQRRTTMLTSIQIMRQVRSCLMVNTPLTGMPT